jgi:type IV secretion system protein VirD4
MATALVVRQESEVDPHWNEKAIQVIKAVLVLILLKFTEDRDLSSVQEIVSDPDLLKAAATKLQQLGGIPARLGNQIKTFFEKDGSGLTKEGAGVLSTATRHLSFLDSELVEKSVATSTFDPSELRKPGTTLFLQIPPDQLEAASGLLRCWMSCLIRVIGSDGDERNGEVLMLLDEASALGSLPALEEALVRGRSAGVRLLMAYQSDSQIRSAFKDKPTLLYDNCTTQIYLGASSYETAERISKSLGDWTQVVESYGETESWQPAAGQSGGQRNRTTSLNYSVSGRALLRPEEILAMNDDYLIAFQRGMSPILAQRVKWYQDPDFNQAREFNQAPAKRSRYAWLWTPPPRKVQVIVACVLGLILLALLNGVNH